MLETKTCLSLQKLNWAITNSQSDCGWSFTDLPLIPYFLYPVSARKWQIKRCTILWKDYCIVYQLSTFHGLTSPAPCIHTFDTTNIFSETLGRTAVHIMLLALFFGQHLLSVCQQDLRTWDLEDYFIFKRFISHGKAPQCSCWHKMKSEWLNLSAVHVCQLLVSSFPHDRKKERGIVKDQLRNYQLNNCAKWERFRT